MTDPRNQRVDEGVGEGRSFRGFARDPRDDGPRGRELIKIVAFLRDARWMTPERARAWRNLSLLAPVIAIGGLFALSHDGVDPNGRPIGTDFISFWTASRLALSGPFAAAYDIGQHWAAQKAAFPASSLGYEAFFYPPIFLLICLPLGLLPYFWALAAWLLSTGLACWFALRRMAGQPVALLTWLAFPAVSLNALFGQNGYLTTALYAVAVATMGRSPWLAGYFLGALVFKPQLLVAVPIVLLVSRSWATMAAAVVTATALGVISLMVLGCDAWRAFIDHAGLARAALEDDAVGAAKMQSFFAAVQLFGAPVRYAWVVQIGAALVTAWWLVKVSRSVPPGVGLGAATAAAVPLMTPFLLGYDLMLLAIPLLWVWCRARDGGFLPWEKIVLMAGFILPMLSASAAAYLYLPLAPPLTAALFAITVRRALAGSRENGTDGARRVTLV